MSPRCWLTAVVLILLALPLYAQKTAPAAAPAHTPEGVPGLDTAAAGKLAQEQFGPGYKVLPEYPAFSADFDGDGIPDVAIPAKGLNPLLNAVEYHYKVIDPYDAFFGFGDPKITMRFDSDDPRQKGLVVLIIHGAKDGGWRAATPKAKFVVINLPFTKLSLSHVLLHKKPIGAIAAEETDRVTSVIYWNGKSYKYEPMGAEAD